MKIRDTYNPNAMQTSIFSLFKENFPDDCPFIQDSYDVQYLSMAYYDMNSGDKNTSRVWNKAYEDYMNNGWSTEEQAKDHANANCMYIIRMKFYNKWLRLWNLLVVEAYNALDNFNKVKSSTRKTNTNMTNNEASDLNTFGFDTISEDGVPKEKSNVETVITGDADDNYVEFEQNDSGRDGKFSAQELLEKEIEVRKNNFYDIMFSDIDSVMANRIYDPEC